MNRKDILEVIEQESLANPDINYEEEIEQEKIFNTHLKSARNIMKKIKDQLSENSRSS